jgi:predicted amidohydrolase YtcJ
MLVKEVSMTRSLSCWFLVLVLLATGCARQAEEPADLLIVNGRIYTFAWGEPDLEGAPAADAPHSEVGWQSDAEAVAVKGGQIVFVGSQADAEKYRDSDTKTLDVAGATVIPGLVDSHTHIVELGKKESQVDLLAVATEEEAVRRVAAFAAGVPDGEWIIGWGWDEGAWANHYPGKELLSAQVPNHPVVLKSLHGFAIWGNQLALQEAGISRSSEEVSGGTILRDDDGEPTGVLLNRATNLLSDVIPEPGPEQLQSYVLKGLEAMARDGYVAIHEAGAGAQLMAAFAALEEHDRLPLRVYAMVRAREPELCRQWLEKGPDADNDSMLTTRSVKAFYDAALGSRGARLLDDYSDRPGHRGTSGGQYGFDEELVAEMMRNGFQAAVHAIGDAGNRETLEFLESVSAEDQQIASLRHRIEHAQVVHPDDFKRFAAGNFIASMQPPHCVEDKTWAEDRLGPQRVKGAYAWRTMRRTGTCLVFNSDLAGSDHSIFYGLHAAITRRDKQKQPPEGWYPEERMTAEEALRGYTTWAAYSAGWESLSGVLAPGRWADITIMDIDPLVSGETDPGKILEGKILATIVAGKVVHDALP